MPEGGYYEKRPRREHRAYLEKRLLERPIVDSVEFLDDFQMVVEREGRSTIVAYVTNLYEIGIADVEEILATAPATTCIVSTMDYNHYSGRAKELAKSRGVGLFRSTELLGAVYYDGQRFLDYVSPEERERLRRQRGAE